MSVAWNNGVFSPTYPGEVNPESGTIDEIAAAERRGYERAVARLRGDINPLLVATSAMAEASWAGTQIGHYHASYLAKATIKAIADHLDAVAAHTLATATPAVDDVPAGGPAIVDRAAVDATPLPLISADEADNPQPDAKNLADPAGLDAAVALAISVYGHDNGRMGAAVRAAVPHLVRGERAAALRKAADAAPKRFYGNASAEVIADWLHERARREEEGK